MKQHIRKKFDLIIFALRESFVALLPYFIISSLGTLAFQGIIFVNTHLNIDRIKYADGILKNIFPILLVISFAYHLAKQFKIKGFKSIILALTTYTSVVSLNHDPLDNTLSLTGKAALFALLIPILTTSLLSTTIKRKWLNLPNYSSLGSHLSTIYNYFPAFILSYLLSLIFFMVLNEAILLLPDASNSTYMPCTGLLLFIRMVCSHLLWFLGLHGGNVFDLLVNKDFLSAPLFTHLSAKNFFDLFVVIGGSGSCLALAIAILLQAKDKHTRTVAKIALPFLAFNISEILIFGLPVVFNRRLFFPFIGVPIVNFISMYGFLHVWDMPFTGQTIPWTTPVFINAYLASPGNLLPVAYKAILLCIDVAIYIPFVRKYVSTQSSIEHLSMLENKLKVFTNIRAREGIKFQQAQALIIKSHIETEQIIELISHNDLCIFYQPKVNLCDQSCQHFEALLRLRLQDGQIMPPYFLTTLEQAGLAAVIDLWVCKQVSHDMQLWKEQSFNPQVSVNLHPDTLQEQDSIKQIIGFLTGFNIEFEIIERVFVGDQQVKAHIQLLLKHGFKLAVDDFGTGYSSLESLNNLPAKVIKLDKSLADIVQTENGFKIYLHTATMCKDLGYQLVAEGIETEQQLHIAKAAGVDYVQGWYFSKALHFDQVQKFSDACAVELSS